MKLEEIAEKLGMKRANLSQYGKELEKAGHVFGKNFNGKNSYTETEFRMIKKMRELMVRGLTKSEAAAEIMEEWKGTDGIIEYKEEKTDENNEFHQEILNELREIKKILNEMHINQQKKGFINLTFCKKTKK